MDIQSSLKSKSKKKRKRRQSFGDNDIPKRATNLYWKKWWQFEMWNELWATIQHLRVSSSSLNFDNEIWRIVHTEKLTPYINFLM